MGWTNGLLNILIIDTANAGGIFVYSGVPQAGNLIGSWTSQAGVDQFGNSYPAGLNVTVGSITGTTFGGTNFNINSNGAFFYSGTPAFGNLTASITTGPGTDSFGNTYFGGITVYDSSGNVVELAAGSIFTFSETAGLFTNLIQGVLLTYQAGGGAGNLISSVAPNAGTDQYGNTYPVGIQVGNNNQINLAPNANNPFNITQVINGIFQGAAQFVTTDNNETIPGDLGAVLLGTGSATKMSTVMTSPIGSSSSQGGAVLIESENDAGTDTAIVSVGTTSSPDGNTINYVPILTVSPFTMILYGSSSGINTVIFNSGAANWTAPPGVTSVKAECWGAGGGGGGGNIGGSPINQNGGGAGGGGEYAADPNIAITPGNNYAYSVAAAASGRGPNVGGNNGGNSTFTGDFVTVTAHGGSGGGPGGSLHNTAGTGGAGGSGSTNAVHFNGGTGGNGGAGGLLNPGGGGGGAGSGGTSSAGNNGQNGTGTNAGNGASAVSGGGNGGNGGGLTTLGNGSAPTKPPGGGGGGGVGANLSAGSGSGGNSSAGQVRLTWSTGVPAILMSASTAAITDQYGNSIPAGVQITGSFPTGDMLVVNNTSTNPSNPSVRFTATTAADRVLGIDVSGDTKKRFQINSNGVIQWGTGAANVDTDLFRGAANTLQTDDAMAFTNIATPAGISGASQIYSIAGQGQMGLVNASGFAQQISGSGLNTTSTTNITGTALTDLGHITVPAGDLVAGSAFQIHASGSFSTGTSAPSSETFGVFWNNTGTNIVSLAVPTRTTSLSGAFWSLDSEINWLGIGVTGKAEGVIRLCWRIGSGVSGSAFWHVTGFNSSLASTLATQSLGLTFQFGSAPTGTDFNCDTIRIARIA